MQTAQSNRVEGTLKLIILKLISFPTRRDGEYRKKPDQPSCHHSITAESWPTIQEHRYKKKWKPQLQVWRNFRLTQTLHSRHFYKRRFTCGNDYNCGLYGLPGPRSRLVPFLAWWSMHRGNQRIRGIYRRTKRSWSERQVKTYFADIAFGCAYDGQPIGHSHTQPLWVKNESDALHSGVASIVCGAHRSRKIRLRRSKFFSYSISLWAEYRIILDKFHIIVARV